MSAWGPGGCSWGGGLPLLLLGVAPDVVLEEQALPGDVGRVLPVLVVVQLLASFPRGLCFGVIGGLLWGTGPVRRSPLHLQGSATGL